jgi:Spy/CpxP family protein refolding chaperone
MKKRIVILAIVLLCIINITALATLSYNRWIKPQRWEGEMEQAAEWEALEIKINLKPNQIQRMQGLRLSFEEEVETLRQQMEEKRLQLIDEVKNPSPDLKYIDRVVDELSELQGEVQKKTIRNLLKDKELLTPGQQERYFSMFEKYMQGQGRGQGRRGRGRGPRWLRGNQDKRGIYRK